MPNPPVPNEIKRRRGTARPDRTPAASNVVALPMVADTLDPPQDLGLDGRRLWARAWHEAIVWLSPHSDMERVEQACRLVDDLAAARERYRATREPMDGRMVATFARELGSALSDLGFTPVARTRLGVAEVTRVTKLDSLRRKAGS
jgi:hypothetical protein